MTLPLSGLWVALATPFRADAELDLPALRRLVRHVTLGGADVLVALGSTGEAATLDELERDRVLACCLDAAGTTPVVAGTGSNDTRRSAERTRRARELGAAGALVVTPYYNKPTPAGLERHYATVAAAAPGLPLVAYNVPGRTGINLRPATLERLWAIPELAAVKESSGDLAQIGEIARTLPAGRALLAGDDALALASVAVGASGLVSVAGNLLPCELAGLVAAARRGDLAEARRLHYRLLPLFDALFAESNPIPLKAGLAALGIASDVVRLPLTRAEETTRRRLAGLLGPLAGRDAA